MEKCERLIPSGNGQLPAGKSVLLLFFFKEVKQCSLAGVMGNGLVSFMDPV